MVKQKVNINQLRVAAINGFLIYIDGKRFSYEQLKEVIGYKSYSVTKQDLRQWEVKTA